MPAKNAGTSITVTCASARSRSAPACRLAKIRGVGLAASIRAATRGNVRMAPRPPSTRPAPISRGHGKSFWQSAPTPIFRSGAISGIGPLRNIEGSTATSGCRRTGALVADHGWKRSFDDPIPLPRGRYLVTLEDAGNYITRLPKAEHEAAERRHAGLEPPRRAGVQS